MIDERMVEEIRVHGPGRMVCPSCGGGSSKERCMSITVDKENNSALWATCFRANCDVTSVRVLDNGFSYSTDAKKPTTSWEYPHPTRRLDELRYPSRALEYEYMLHWQHLDELGVRVREGMGSELVFPVRNSTGEAIGHTVKRLSMTSSPALSKASNFFDKTSNDWEGGAFVRAGGAESPPKAIILVEDMLSACRITQEAPGLLVVALLGTTVSHYLTNVLSKMSGSGVDIPVTLALDPDATSKAIKTCIASNSRLRFKAARLPADPKDMVTSELERLIEIAVA
jgi:hypothetical protein